MKNSDQQQNCPVENTLSLIGGKWKAIILWYLSSGTKRYGELKKLIPGVTEKMLIQCLRQLETDLLVERKVYNEIPPKVDYSLTQKGNSIVPIIKAMHDWSNNDL